MPVDYTTRWRVYIKLMQAKYYANVDPPTPLPRVRWMMSDQEYPDHFDYGMACMIQSYYDDQKPMLEKVVVQREDEIG